MNLSAQLVLGALSSSCNTEHRVLQDLKHLWLLEVFFVPAIHTEFLDFFFLGGEGKINSGKMCF